MVSKIAIAKLSPPEECPHCKLPVYWEERVDTSRLATDGVIEISWACDWLASGCCASHGQDYECDYVHGPFTLRCSPEPAP